MEKREIELAENRSETSTRETRQIELQREEENFYYGEERDCTECKEKSPGMHAFCSQLSLRDVGLEVCTMAEIEWLRLENENRKINAEVIVSMTCNVIIKMIRSLNGVQ